MFSCFFLFYVYSLLLYFINAIFNKLCWILGLIAAFLFYKMLSVPMMDFVKNQIASDVLSFLVIFIAVFLFVKIIQTILSKVFDGEIMKGLDRSLGFFFGIVEGITILFFITFILLNQPWFDCSKLFEGSLFIKILGPLLDYSNKTFQEKQSVQPETAITLISGGIECLKIL